MYQKTQPTSGNEFVIQISANLQYLKTYNYDLFSFYPTNRHPSHWQKILESIEIQDLTDRQPILVYKCPQTEKLFISDGQNRFLACKNSKRPVYAIVVVGESLQKGETSLSVLNSYQKNWTADDYLGYYSSKGIGDYTRMKNAKEATGFSVSILRRFWVSGDGNKMRKNFEAGRLNFPQQAVNVALVVKRCTNAIYKNKLAIVNITSKAALISSVFSFLRSGATSREFVNQISKYGYKIEDCGAAPQYFALWNHIYNHRKHGSNKRIFTLPKTMQKRATVK